MAPPSRTTKSPKSILKKSTNSTSHQESLFPSSKKDKRRIKHEQLLNKVSKSSAKKPRRRRPDKKLVATLDSLADALPTDDDHNTDAQGAAGGMAEDQVNIIKRNSLKSKPGALKRREKLDKGERDRFAKNMAQLAAPRPVAHADQENAGVENSSKTVVPSATDRWAALRGFISQTLETKPELQNMKT
jgi:hypothetical protein